MWFLPLPVFYSQTGIAIPAFLCSVYGWALLGLVFAATLLLSKQARRTGLLHRLAPPVILLLAAGVFAIYALAGPGANPFFRLRFELSQGALTEAATRKLASPSSDVPAWIGLFPVLSKEVQDQSVRFITTNCGVVDSCGLVYSPSQPPRRVYEDRFVQLSGDWYHVLQGF